MASQHGQVDSQTFRKNKVLKYVSSIEIENKNI